MKDGASVHSQENQQNPTLANVVHNLKITEECFRYLLGMLKTDGLEQGGMIEVENVISLCATNAQLIDNLHGLLSKSDHGSQIKVFEYKPSSKGVTQLSSYSKISAGYIEKPKNKYLDIHFRESIVNLMILSLQCWEHCTQKNKIELAEESNIWRINVDGGRLRVRSMDRYLNVNKLPKVPRWRDVLKTAYFVLDRADSNSTIKRQLEESLEETLSIMRKQSI